MAAILGPVRKKRFSAVTNHYVNLKGRQYRVVEQAGRVLWAELRGLHAHTVLEHGGRRFREVVKVVEERGVILRWKQDG